MIFQIVSLREINGYVSDRADVAVVALDSEEGLFEVAAFHVIYHVLTRELGLSGGRQFVSAVLAEYRKAVGDVRFNEDLEDVARRYGVDKAGLTDEDTRWQVYEEMAAQYFGVIAAEHMDGLVDGLNRTGGQKLLSKVREILRQFVEEIRAALNQLAGRDPATAAALKTEAENARRILDLFDEAVAQTREERTARLEKQGERIREEAVRAESGERSAERYSIKATRNMDYAEQMKLIEERKLNGSNSLYIGNAPALTAAGFSDAPFAMNQADFRKARREEGNNKNDSSHSVPLKCLREAPCLRTRRRTAATRSTGWCGCTKTGTRWGWRSAPRGTSWGCTNMTRTATRRWRPP